MNRLCFAVMVAWVGFETGMARAEAPFDDLLQQIPESANVVTLIDAERIRSSAVAREQGLVKGSEGESSDQTIVPRQDVYQVVLAATIRGFRESLVESQTAVFRLRENPSLAGVAAAYRGRLEELGDREYAALPHGAMAFSMADRTLTVIEPIDRRRASQSIARSKQTSPAKLSAYIQKAVHRKTIREQVLVAMDLAHLYPKSTVFLYLQNSKAFASRPVDIQQAAALISGIQGATLALRFSDRIEGEVTLDFDRSAELASEWTRSLFLEILSDTGATIEDFETWTFARGERSITLKGDLSTSGLRRVISLLDFPTRVPQQAASTAAATLEEQRRRTTVASLEYFRAVDQLYSDLRSPSKTRNLATSEYGMWYDKYSRKIESLPSLDVDPELLAFGDSLTIQLRVLATKFRMVGIKAGTQSRNPNVVVNYFSTWYGSYYETRQGESDFDYTQKIERAAAAGDKFAAYEQIDLDRLTIRRAMTDRYSVEF
jgi:hypothetical protein